MASPTRSQDADRDGETVGARVRQAREEAGVPLDRVDIRGLDPEEYQALEDGCSEAECWGPLLGQLATALSVPTNRLVSATGRSADLVAGVTALVGQLVAEARDQRAMALDELADELGAGNVTVQELHTLEEGATDMEGWGPKLLRVAEAFDVPLFELVAGVDPITVKQIEARRQKRDASRSASPEHGEPATLAA